MSLLILNDNLEYYSHKYEYYSYKYNNITQVSIVQQNTMLILCNSNYIYIILYMYKYIYVCMYYPLFTYIYR